jgi:hypothetical protein
MARPLLNRSTVILVVACAGAGALACATTEVQQDNKYPRRPSGCDIALYHTSVPGAAAWDDLGIAEISCHVSSPLSQCLQMLKAEGCRLGGDLIYNVPRSPLRPQDQVMVFRGQVAHTRGGGPPKKDEDADLPPPATAAEAAQPVIPLTGPAAPKAP